jgi:hypothetical protein
VTPPPLHYATSATPRVRSKSAAPWLIGAGLLAGAFAGAWWATDAMFVRFDVTIVVTNQTNATLRRVEFVHDGRRITMDNVAPGTASRQVRLRGTGPMWYSVTPQTETTMRGRAASHLDSDCNGYQIRLRVPGGSDSEAFSP